MKKNLWICFILLLSPAVARSEKLPESARQVAIQRLTQRVLQARTDARTPEGIPGQLAANASLLQVVTEVATGFSTTRADPQSIRRALVPAFEAARTDEQAGAGPQSSGTTNLVSKGSIAGILGLAVENGALSRTTSGTTVTLQGTPIGILETLAGKGYINGYDSEANTPFLQVLRRVGFSTTFDTARGAETDSEPAPFTASGQQISAYSLRVGLFNQRDPRHPAYARLWNDAAETALASVANVKNRLDRALVQKRAVTPALHTWETNLVQTLVTAGTDEGAIKAALDSALSELENTHSEIFEGLDPLVEATNMYLTKRDNILKRVAKGPIATYEFTNNRQVDQPDLLNHRLILETDLLRNGKSDFTLNASLTQFSTTGGVPGTKRIRDYQFGAQLDMPIADNGNLENWLLTFSWRYMRLLESQKIPLTTLVAPEGVINLVQTKLTIPVKDGIKVPLSITWSNRSELVKEERVRANFGLTFDIDSLVARLKP